MKSPRQAIAQHCKGCISDEHCAGTWRQQVEACNITDCALYEHRPLSFKTRQLLKDVKLPDHTHDTIEFVRINAPQDAKHNQI